MIVAWQSLAGSDTFTAMEFRLNELEIRILAYLREHVMGYGADWAIGSLPSGDAQVVERQIQCLQELSSLTDDQKSLVRAFTYLRGWNLVVGNFHLNDNRYSLGKTWMTHLGEAYMRELEARLSEVTKGRPLTLRLLGEVWGVAKDIITQTAAAVLSEYAKSINRL